MEFKDDLSEELAEKYSQQLEENDTECPYDDCSGNLFDAEIWVDDNDRFTGQALCLSCNRSFELDLDDSQAQDAIGEVEDAIDDLKASFDDI